MASDADIESSFSDTDSGYLYRERGIQILVFQCDQKDFITTGEILRRNALTTAERVQRDVILSYQNPNCLTINNDQFSNIFGSNHYQFLSNLHSILILLPCEKNSQVTFFISKQFVNTPTHASQNISLLENPAPFFCRSLRKPVTKEYIGYVKEELSDHSDFLFYYNNKNVETSLEYFNGAVQPVYYLHVVKLKTDIVKFVYHKSYLISHSLHIECLSTYTIGEVLQHFLKQISTNVDEFRNKEIADLSVTYQNGVRADSNLDAIMCLLFLDRAKEREYLSHSYPTFYVHLTPKEHEYFPIKVRIIGDDRGHMYPFTVFIRNDFSYSDLVNEISKHCHWKPKSFEVCAPNSTKCLKPVTSLTQLDFELNSASVLSARKIQKLQLTIQLDFPDIKSFAVEEYPNCSVELLKNKISKRCNILPKQFDLIYKNQVLDEDTLLDNIIEKNAVLGLKLNEKRIIFRLYLHKGLRSDDSFEKIVPIKVDDPEDAIGDISRSFADKLGVTESDLHITHHGFYMEKTLSYKDAEVSDGKVLCLHCSGQVNDTKDQNTDVTVLQANPSGCFERVSETRMAAMERKMREFELKAKRKEPKITVMTKKQHNQKVFDRMISVPSKRNSLTVNNQDCGYKSDTDLLRYERESAIPKPSPSDSQISTPSTLKNPASPFNSQTSIPATLRNQPSPLHSQTSTPITPLSAPSQNNSISSSDSPLVPTKLNVYTVKPVLRDHFFCQTKKVFHDRWSFIAVSTFLPDFFPKVISMIFLLEKDVHVLCLFLFCFICLYFALKEGMHMYN